MTAARLVWDAAGSPRSGASDPRPCWWCGLACDCGAVPQGDAIPDSFPDVGAVPASEVVCAACAWTLSDQIALPAHLADAGIAKRLDAGGRLRVSVAGDEAGKPRLFLRLSSGDIGVWSVAKNAAGDEPWTEAIPFLRDSPADVGVCKLLAVVPMSSLSAGATARFRNYHHLATPGRWCPSTAADRAAIRGWLIDPPAGPWVCVLGDGQKHGVIYADGAIVRPGERPALWAWGRVVAYEPAGLAAQLTAWLDLRRAGASDNEIGSGRYSRAIDPVVLRRAEAVLRPARDEPALIDVLALLRQTPKETA